MNPWDIVGRAIVIVPLVVLAWKTVPDGTYKLCVRALRRSVMSRSTGTRLSIANPPYWATLWVVRFRSRMLFAWE